MSWSQGASPLSRRKLLQAGHHQGEVSWRTFLSEWKCRAARLPGKRFSLVPHFGLGLLNDYLCLKPRPNDRNVSTQHCWAQHVTRVWPPCCKMLRNVSVVGSNLTVFKLEPTRHNMSPHMATGWSNEGIVLHPTMLRYICCVDMLRSFGRGFKNKLTHDWPMIATMAVFNLHTVINLY